MRTSCCAESRRPPNTCLSSSWRSRRSAASPRRWALSTARTETSLRPTSNGASSRCRRGWPSACGEREDEMSERTIYRADVIGSMLRPKWLVEARAAMRSGSLEPEEYRMVEDRAVEEALRIQEKAGVDVATDGEMRRDIFFDAFVTGMDGFSHEYAWRVQFHREHEDRAFEVSIPFTVTDKISARSSPALAEFIAAKDRTSLPLKVTVPS